MTQEQYYLNKIGKGCYKLPERPKPLELETNYLPGCINLRPTHSDYLIQLNMLSEFSTPEQQAEARSNLGITPLLEELNRLLDERVLTTQRAVVEQTLTDNENRVLSSHGLYLLILQYYTKEDLDTLITKINELINNLIFVDDLLSNESTNPVLNKILTDAINGIYEVIVNRIINPRKKDDGMGYNSYISVREELALKADKADLGNYYTQQQVDSKLANKFDSTEINNYYNKLQIDGFNLNLQNQINGIELHADDVVTLLVQTAEYLQKLKEVVFEDLVNLIPTNVSSFNNDAEYVTESELAPVAKSGSYTDLEDKPDYLGYTDTAIANLINSAPATLDTLKEIADKLGEDDNALSGIINTLATKANKSDVQDNEQVISAALNDLNDRIIELNTNKTDSSDLATVATSGSYTDLSDKPDVVVKSNTQGLIKNDGTIDTNTYLTNPNNYYNKSDVNNLLSQKTDQSSISNYIPNLKTKLGLYSENNDNSGTFGPDSNKLAIDLSDKYSNSGLNQILLRVRDGYDNGNYENNSLLNVFSNRIEMLANDSNHKIKTSQDETFIKHNANQIKLTESAGIAIKSDYGINLNSNDGDGELIIKSRPIYLSNNDKLNLRLSSCYLQSNGNTEISAQKLSVIAPTIIKDPDYSTPVVEVLTGGGSDGCKVASLNRENNITVNDSNILLYSENKNIILKYQEDGNDVEINLFDAILNNTGNLEEELEEDERIIATALNELNDNKESKVDIVAPVNTTDATQPITTLVCEVGKYYRVDVEVETLAITLPSIEDTTHLSSIMIMLTTGNTPAVTFASATSGVSVIARNGFSINANTTYEINAIFNGSMWVIAATELDTTDITPSGGGQ